jgi:hypothetical protein
VNFAVGELGVGIFPIRKAIRLRNWWLQSLERFFVVFHCILEFSDCLLVPRVDNGSPGSRYFFHYGLYGLSIRARIY